MRVSALQLLLTWKAGPAPMRRGRIWGVRIPKRYLVEEPPRGRTYRWTKRCQVFIPRVGKVAAGMEWHRCKNPCVFETCWSHRGFTESGRSTVRAIEVQE